jgi:hypothetical protein
VKFPKKRSRSYLLSMTRDPQSVRRDLQAYATVVPHAGGWIYHWHAEGLPELLGKGRECPMTCVSPDAAWALFAVVLKGAQRDALRTARSEVYNFAECIYGAMVTAACLLLLAVM